MDHDDFANVNWQNSPAGQEGVTSIDGQRGETGDVLGNTNGNRHEGVEHLERDKNADAMDLAGVGEGVLECTVTSPIKENDGTKDAYISYLVTTNVGSLTCDGSLS